MKKQLFVFAIAEKSVSCVKSSLYAIARYEVLYSKAIKNNKFTLSVMSLECEARHGNPTTRSVP
jgi:hypothetical protein